MSGIKMPDYYCLNSIKSKIKAEDEKRIRGLSFAKLYYANKDYEKALTYLNEYLTIKNNSAEAYRVLGDVYEALDNNEKSFEAYKKSYFIDKSQDNLLIKICEKLENLNLDTQTIKLWLDRLEKKYPNHQSVFNLKDKLQLENGNNSRLEDTFRDLSNVKLSDLTDDKVANLSCSFLNSKSPSFTSNQFKSLERSQDRLFKKVIEFEENFDKKIDQLIGLVKENHKMFGQLKNEVDKINSTLVKLQLEQDYEDEEYDEDDEEDQNNENEEVKTNSVFSRLGPNMTSTTSTISNPVQISSNVAKDNTKPLSELFKDQYNNAWECKECYVKNDNKKTLCSACEAPNPAQSLSSLHSPSKQPAISNSQPFSNKPSQAPIFGGKTPFSTSIPSSGFLFGQSTPQIPDSTQTNVFSKLAQTIAPKNQIDTNVAKDNAKPLSELFKDQYNNTLPATLNIQTIDNSPLKPPTTQIFNNSTLPASVLGNVPPFQPPTLQAPVFGDKTPFPPATSNIQAMNNSPLKPSTTQTFNNSTLQAPVFGQTNSVFVFGQNIPLIPTKETKTEQTKIKNIATSEQPEVGNGEDEPQIDFTPVIPLPPKIDVITGEEDETVLFTHRAKLFRFVDGEFKERGLGDIKILFDKKNNKYRLLMRREQILKVCLNSPILANFTFEPLPDNKTGNMLKFGAFDFSEEKSNVEVFLIKFKTKEIADQFKKEVYRIVKTLGGKVLDGEIPLEKAEPINKDDQSKSKTELMESDIEIIFVREPTVEQKEKAESFKLPINFYRYEDAKPCPGCNGCKDFIPKLKYELQNKEDKENEPNENKENSSKENQVVAENNSENLFSFAVATAGAAKASWTKPTEQPNWMKSSITPLFSSEQSNDRTNDDPEAEVPLEFMPVIPLPPKIDVITGEEDEEVLFSNRAKLYKFTKNEWKERGIGDFKVLRHKQTRKIRFLMRREQVHKICLNHLVDKNLKIGRRPQRDNIYQWSASDFSESTEGEPSLFNIRFKNKDIGIKFIETLKNNIDGFKETSE